MKLDKDSILTLKVGDTIEIDSRWFTGITKVESISVGSSGWAMYITQGFGYTPNMFNMEDRIRSLRLLSPEDVSNEEEYYKDLLDL